MLHQDPSATLGNSLSLSPSREEIFMHIKVIRTEGPHSYLCVVTDSLIHLLIDPFPTLALRSPHWPAV